MLIKVHALVIEEVLETYEIFKQLVTQETLIILAEKLNTIQLAIKRPQDFVGVEPFVLIDELNTIIAKDLGLKHKGQ